MKTAVTISLLLVSAACTERGARYPLRGQIVDIQSSRSEVTIKHDAVPGYMDAMTMPFQVRDLRALEGHRPGDLVTATLVVTRHGAHVEDLKKIGFAELTTAPATPSASSGFELIQAGEPVPDQEFTTHQNRLYRLAHSRGKAVALTFIYTRCPVPTFCPMMDRHFASLQKEVAGDDRLRGNVQLLSITFDPAHDTPEVLAKHAKSLDADPKSWVFVTGSRDDVDRFAARFGVSIVRDVKDSSNITHNLRTAVIDPAGKLVKVYSGADWKPSALLQDLRTVLTADARS